jgi:uncharacterized protein YbjT (DUF2867 family)
MKLRAIVVGATGAVGSALVRELLASPRWMHVTALVRRKSDAFAPVAGADKLEQIVVDMAQLERDAAGPAKDCDAAFCTMGVGQPSKVSKDELWKVDVDYAAAFARACKTAGIRHLSLLGALGANAKSRSYYLKAKGSAEEALRAQAFPRVTFFRPSLLVTKEIRYGFQDRVTQTLFPIVSRVLPRRLHEIRVEELARAMRLNAERPEGPSVEVLQYPDFQNLLRDAAR